MCETPVGAREQLIEQLTEVHRLVRRGLRAPAHRLGDAPLEPYREAELTMPDMAHRLAEHAGALEDRLAALGRPPAREVGAAERPPAAAEPASGALDADREFLQRLALAYMRLGSAGRLQQDQATAELADRGYREVQHLVRERVSRAQPRAAAADHASPTSGTRGAVPVQEGGP